MRRKQSERGRVQSWRSNGEAAIAAIATDRMNQAREES